MKHPDTDINGKQTPPAEIIDGGEYKYGFHTDIDTDHL